MTSDELNELRARACKELDEARLAEQRWEPANAVPDPTPQDYAQAIAAAEAAAGLVTVPGWQPIESAPRDREVLLYVAETNEQFVAFWGTCPQDGDTQWVFARGDNIAFLVRDPTHWAPLLPPPPTTTEETT